MSGVEARAGDPAFENLWNGGVMVENGGLQQEQGIKEARELAKAYESIAGRMNGFMFRCRNDEQYTMLVLVGMVEMITGYAQKDLLYNRKTSYVSLIHPDDVPKVDTAIEKGIKARKNWAVDYRIICFNGKEMWVNEHGGAVYNQEGQVEYLEGVVVDISDRLQEIERRKSMEQVGELSKKIIKETKNILHLLQALKTLGLNARLEAGRAGEAGKGFSVIADQVKELAKETGTSAQSINDLIAELEKRLKDASEQ